MPHATASAGTRRRDVLSWVALAVAAGGVAVVVWAALSAGGAVVHGHPAYAGWLVATLVGSLLAGAWVVVPRARRGGGWRTTGRVVLTVLAAGWIALTAWLRPYEAVGPALAAMASDAGVSVVETPTEIVLAPSGDRKATGVLFQPGALVDPRAYAAVLRPLAEAGHEVVIVKQPLGIAFLALGAWDAARGGHPEVERWVVGGHSLGGTVAALEVAGAPAAVAAPVPGLLLFASYPAADISGIDAAVVSLSGTRDGLATPAKIEASRADLPADAEFVVIDGANHAQFGDYGPQPGDNAPTIDDDDARAQIGAVAVALLDRIDR